MIRYYLNNEECNPDNREEIQYEFNFGENRDKTQLELSVTSLVFKLEDRSRIENWIATYSEYVGMPLDIVYSDGTTIKYILDFTQDLVRKANSIECKIVRYKGWDHFTSLAEGLAFQNESINWVSSDFKEVDYVVIPENQVSLFVSLSISIFVLAKELATAVEKTVEATTVLIKASVPVGVPPAPDWGAIIVASLKLAAIIAYTTAIAIALANLTKQLIELIFPKLRQYKAITYKNLIKKGVEHLGFTLSSSLLNELSELTVLPVPLQNNERSIWDKVFDQQTSFYTEGYPTSQDTIPTLSLAIDEFEKITNAETRVVDGVVKIEPKAFFEKNANQTIKRSFNVQEDLEQSNSINSEEQYKRLVALYQTDSIDMNTFDNTEGTVSEISNEVINSPDPELELIKNYTELRLNFARGTRKNDFTWLEKAARGFAQAVDAFLNTSLTSGIDKRKGIMQISSQYFSITKLLYCQGSKLAQNQNDFIGTDKIIQKHLVDSLENNQKDVYQNMPIATTEQEFFQFLNNNFVNLESGKTVEITKASWSEHRHVALVDYKERKEAVNIKSIAL